MTSNQRPGVTRRMWPLAAALLLVFAAGCRQRDKAMTQAVQTDPEATNLEALRTASHAYWQAKVDDDCAKIFAFRDPPRRVGYTAEQYCAWHKESEPFEVNEFTIHDVIADDTIGWIDLENTVRMRLIPVSKPVNTRRWEKWMRIDDDWYPVPKELQDNFPIAPALRNQAEEDLLMARFTDSWTAKLDRDWDRLYALTDPGDLETVSLAQFTETHELIGYQHYFPLWVQVVGKYGTVRTEVVHKVNDPSLTKLPPKEVTINERWIKRDGIWYMDLDPSK